MPVSAEDIRWMRSALTLSQRGLGQVWPNPSVGCVIVRDGVVLGRGVTAAGGRPHAEAAALAQAGEAARDATAYVTLEPCGRPGRDESCTDKLIRAGVARVVFAATDPNPQVNGHGCERLNAAGIGVSGGVLEAEAARSHAGFFSRIRKGRPLVTLKLATSLDGRIATVSGESRWITGEESRRRVHLMRASHDAVMIGAGTARDDDPMLDVRDLGTSHQPIRIVLDPNLTLDPASRLAVSAKASPVWLVHRPGAASAVLADTGVHLIDVPLSKGVFDLHAVLQRLGQSGLTRVLCEGGGKLAASLIASDLADRIVLFHAGKVFGGDGLPAIAELGLARLGDAKRFSLRQTFPCGSDLMSEWECDRPLEATG
jgi:diaminohydroxyphosphoribosylaminopyrimidine deaminase / 5-amino-6-(5-phosphoribosylamino)uracil reductase